MPEVNLNPLSGADDCGGTNVTSTSISLSLFTTSARWGGVRFYVPDEVLVAGEQGKIVSAQITFTAYSGSMSTGSNRYFYIYGHDVDSSPDFNTSYPYNRSGQTTTANTYAYLYYSGGEETFTYDFTDQLKELVARGGWTGWVTVLLYASDNSLTLSSYERDAYATTLTINVSSLTQTDTFTADASLNNTISGSFSADAEIVDGAFKANAVIQNEVSGNYTADTIIQNTVGGSYLADSVIEGSIQGSFTADSYLEIVPDGAFFDIFQSTVVWALSDKKGTFTTDAVILSPTSSSFSANAFIVTQVLDSFTADAILHESDTYAIDGDSGSGSVVAIVGDGVDTGGFLFTIPEEDLDAGDGYRVVSATLRLQAESGFSDTGWHYLTVYGVDEDSASDFTDMEGKPKTTAHTDYSYYFSGTSYQHIDVTEIVREIANRPGWTGPVMFAVIATSNPGTYSSFYSKSHDPGASTLTVTYSGFAPSFTADAYLGQRISQSFTADAYLHANNFSVDSYIVYSVPSSILADAVIQAPVSASTYADAVIESTASGAFAADAFISSLMLDSATQELIRSEKPTSVLYLTTYVPLVLWEAQINDAAIGIGETSITFDGGSGLDFSGIGEIQEVLVGSTKGDDDIGRLRVRAISSGDGGITGTLTVARHSLILNDDYWLTFHLDYPVKPRYLQMQDDGDPVNAYVLMDGDIAYANQNENTVPVVIAGGHRADFIRDGSWVVTPPFSDSYATADGATITSYAASVYPTGPSVVVDSGTGDCTITFTSPGPYWVKYTVTDSNGTSQDSYRFYYAHSDVPTNEHFPHYEFSLESMSGDFSSGWSAQLQFKTDVGVGTIPDNALSILWQDMRFGETLSPKTPFADNSTTLLAGYIRANTDEETQETGVGKLLFTLETVHAILDRIYSYSVGMSARPTVGKWIEFDGDRLTVGLTIHTLWRWCATVMEVNDVYGVTDNTDLRAFSEIQDGSVLGMASNMIGSIRGRITCAKNGALHIVPEQQMLPDQERFSLPVAAFISEEDFSDTFSITNEDVNVTSQARVTGEYFDGTFYVPNEAEDNCDDPPCRCEEYPCPNVVKVCAVAPGPIPETEGGSPVSLGGQVFASLDHGKQIVGRFLAKTNNHTPEFRVTLRGHYVPFLETAFNQRWLVTLPSESNRRGIVWENYQVYLTSVVCRYDEERGFFVSDAVFEPDSPGFDGELEECPDPAPRDIDVPDYEIPPPTIYTQGYHGVWTANKTHYMRDGSSSWTLLSSTIVDDMVIDPWDVEFPYTNTTLWRCGGGFVERSVNGGSVWSDVTPPGPFEHAPSVSDITFTKLSSNFSYQGNYACVGRYNDGVTWYSWICYTADNGSTWTVEPLGPQTTLNGWVPSGSVSAIDTVEYQHPSISDRWSRYFATMSPTLLGISGDWYVDAEPDGDYEYVLAATVISRSGTTLTDEGSASIDPGNNYHFPENVGDRGSAVPISATQFVTVACPPDPNGNNVIFTVVDASGGAPVYVQHHQTVDTPWEDTFGNGLDAIIAHALDDGRVVALVSPPLSSEIYSIIYDPITNSSGSWIDASGVYMYQSQYVSGTVFITQTANNEVSLFNAEDGTFGAGIEMEPGYGSTVTFGDYVNIGAGRGLLVYWISSNDVKAVLVDISGMSLSLVGSPLTLNYSADSYQISAAYDGEHVVLVSYRSSTNSSTYYKNALGVAGDVLVDYTYCETVVDGYVVAHSHDNYWYAHGPGGVDINGTMSLLSPGGSYTDTGYTEQGEAKVLGVSIGPYGSGGVAWVTLWTGDRLYLERWDLATMAMVTQSDLGPCTEAELDGRIYSAFPMAYSDSVCYVYGRMLDPVGFVGTYHLLRTGNSGGSFTVVPTGWATNDSAGAAIITQSGEIFAIRNIIDGGTELYRGNFDGVSLVSSTPANTVAPKGMAIRVYDGFLYAGEWTPGPSQVYAASPPYNQWSDITFDHDTTEGVIVIVPHE